MKEEIKRDEHGRFVRQGTPGPGRPAEARNRVTRDAKKIFNLIMEGEIPKIKKALAQLKDEDPYKYLNTLTKLMSFYWPQKLDMEIDNPYPSYDLSILTDEELVAYHNVLEKLDQNLKLRSSRPLDQLTFEQLYELKHGKKSDPDDEGCG